MAVAGDGRGEPELRGTGDADGHRKRLRQRFLAETGETLTDADLLELLLCFAIPRKDVRALAELLLQRFGTLPCTLAAARHDLQTIDGLGDASIALIKLVDCLRQRVLAPSVGTCDVPVDGQQLHLFPPPERIEEPVEADEVQQEPPSLEPLPTASPARRSQRRASAARQGTELFAKAALKEAVALLPTLPDTDDLDEIGRFLRQALPFSAAQTRSRNAEYIIRRMFPQGYADRALRLFARQYVGTPALRDVCYYRFVKAEPLMVRVAEALLWPNLGGGCVPRAAIADFVATSYPAIRSVSDYAQAIADALNAGGIARVDRRQAVFALREIPLPAFAFVLHSEFPEPGIYDLEAIEHDAVLRALLWKGDQVLSTLYELRNRGLITKVTEIDRLRQFTTRLTLDEVVERLVTGPS